MGLQRLGGRLRCRKDPLLESCSDACGPDRGLYWSSVYITYRRTVTITEPGERLSLPLDLRDLDGLDV